ncbi:hypothetical protein GCM10022205_17150 [Spinactinospora alkalitolerans]
MRTGTGLGWRNLPERYGPWESAAGRHRRWSLEGTWTRTTGRPRTRPDRLPGDNAYSSAAIRIHPARRSITATIAQPADQRADRKRKGSAGGIPPAFDRGAHRGRDTVERSINRPSTTGAVATGYDKTAAIFDGTVQVASVRIRLRDPTRSKKLPSRARYSVIGRPRKRPRSPLHGSWRRASRRSGNAGPRH